MSVHKEILNKDTPQEAVWWIAYYADGSGRTRSITREPTSREVVGSIPTAPTTKAQQTKGFGARALPFPPRLRPEQDVKVPQKVGENAGSLFSDCSLAKQRPGFTTKRDAIAQRGHDLYETPPEATRAVLEVERLPRRVWEPACGRGAIVRVLRAAGHQVVASDLVDYGDPTHFYRRDFLTERRAPDGVEAIITNPPYSLAEQFVGHALELCPRVVMLLRLGFLESERRRPILDNGMLARVYVFRNRLPMMHRDGWTGRRATSSIAFAWFVWDRAHRGRAEIERISWSHVTSLKEGEQI
jgi:hypothetical protein